MNPILPRYTQKKIATDPLETQIAQTEAREQAARQEIANGRTIDANPQDLRGIPIIAKGVTGTSPGTHPHHAIR